MKLLLFYFFFKKKVKQKKIKVFRMTIVGGYFRCLGVILSYPQHPFFVIYLSSHFVPFSLPFFSVFFLIFIFFCFHCILFYFFSVFAFSLFIEFLYILSPRALYSFTFFFIFPTYRILDIFCIFLFFLPQI